MNIRGACLISFVFLFFTFVVQGKNSDPIDDLERGLALAKSTRCMVFIQLSPSKDPNSLSLTQLIRGQHVSLPDSDFIYLSLNYEDSKVLKSFLKTFPGTFPGHQPPFVLIAAWDGTELVRSSGMLDQQGCTNLIEKARSLNKFYEESKKGKQ